MEPEAGGLALYGISSKVPLARIHPRQLVELIEDTYALTRRRRARAEWRDLAAGTEPVIPRRLIDHAVRGLSEEIGELAAVQAIRREFSGAELIYRGRGPGTLDLVFQWDGGYLIVEAKGVAEGGRARLGTRRTPRGRAQQGTTGYARDVLREMGDLGGRLDDDAADVAELLREELDRAGGSVMYIKAETSIPGGDAPLETTLSLFRRGRTPG